MTGFKCQYMRKQKIKEAARALKIIKFEKLVVRFVSLKNGLNGLNGQKGQKGHWDYKSKIQNLKYYHFLANLFNNNSVCPKRYFCSSEISRLYKEFFIMLECLSFKRDISLRNKAISCFLGG